MRIAQYDPAALGRPAWNAGRKVGVKKPLKQRQIWAILPRAVHRFSESVDSRIIEYVIPDGYWNGGSIHDTPIFE